MRKYFLSFFSIFLVVFFLFSALTANAQYGLDVTAGKAGYKSGQTPFSMTTTVINVTLSLIYIIFFILMLYAGIRWMTAQGNEEYVTKAKNILEAAIIGLVIISAAYAITNFILGKLKAGSDSEESSTIPVSTEKGCVSKGDDISTVCSLWAITHSCPGDFCEADASGACKPKAGKTTADFCHQFSSEGSCTAGTVKVFCT